MKISSSIKFRKYSLLFLKFLFLLGYVFLLGLSFSFNYSTHIDSKISEYQTQNKSITESFIHSKISRTQNLSLTDFNRTSSNLVREMTTDFMTYSSYLTIGGRGDMHESFDLLNENTGIDFDVHIIDLPFRSDMNRTYLESMRLRQYRTDVDSRVVKDGYDFSFYITSTMADYLIHNSQIYTDYDSILDDEIGTNYNLIFEQKSLKGYVSNIVYIENDNPISTHLNSIFGNFIIFQGNKNTLFPEREFIFNYSFLNTHSTINSSLKFLKDVNFGEITFNDNNGSLSSTLILNVYDHINEPYTFSSISIFVIIVTVVFSIIILTYFVFHFFRRNTLSLFSDYTTLIISFVFYYALIRFIRMFNSAVYISFMLSNIFIGVITIWVMISYLCFVSNKIKKLKTFIQNKRKKV